MFASINCVEDNIFVFSMQENKFYCYYYSFNAATLFLNNIRLFDVWFPSVTKKN